MGGARLKGGGARLKDGWSTMVPSFRGNSALHHEASPFHRQVGCGFVFIIHNPGSITN